MSSAANNEQLEALLDYLKHTRGFDFTGYKRNSLMRRIRKRMREVQVEHFEEYIDYLEVHPEEFALLFNTILINVTTFFRDPESWDYLTEEILPHIIAEKKADDSIRVWDAGCASGEEAYTTAIVLAEKLGLEQFRQRVKIYATDIDEEALLQARHGSYSARDLENLSPELREQYFEVTGSRYVFRGDLRRLLIFGRHDLVQDAPISRIDLLLCRNTLMYFNAETQSRVLGRLHFALNDSGYIFLGKAETLLTHANLFTSLHLKYRIFTKVPKVALRDRLSLLAQTGNQEAGNHLLRQARLRDTAFEVAPIAQVVVDLHGVMLLANQAARQLFGLDVRDLGRPFRELELSYRPVDLRSRIDQVLAERLPIHFANQEYLRRTNEDVSYLDIQVSPLLDANSSLLGVNITFRDVTRYNQLLAELQRSTQDLETAYEELQSTNEELETTNEELQSTVEELETMNEELQSTNEELQATNDELRIRTEEINQVNSFLESILSSLQTGVVVLKKDLTVHIWNDRVADLWGLRADEAQGQPFLALDIGLPAEKLRPLLSSYLKGGSQQQIILDAVNRRGRQIRCVVTCTPLVDIQGEIQGVIILMEEQQRHSTRNSEEKK